MKVIALDRDRLPPGTYQDAGFESRQVFDFKISRVVTEYRAQVLQDARAKRYVADFPDEVTQAVQYGRAVKAHAVYLSQFQLSTGSLFNFNKGAYYRLEKFDTLAKQQLIDAPLPTPTKQALTLGANVCGCTVFQMMAMPICIRIPKKGADAMAEIGVIPFFRGTLIHDHWKSYFTYDKCAHALSNTHRLRKAQYGQSCELNSYLNFLSTEEEMKLC